MIRANNERTQFPGPLFELLTFNLFVQAHRLSKVLPCPMDMQVADEGGSFPPEKLQDRIPFLPESLREELPKRIIPAAHVRRSSEHGKPIVDGKSIFCEIESVEYISCRQNTYEMYRFRDLA